MLINEEFMLNSKNYIIGLSRDAEEGIQLKK